jgi:hypothetical protein
VQEKKDDEQNYLTFKIGSKTYNLDSSMVNFYIINSTNSKFEIAVHDKSYDLTFVATGINPFDTNIEGTYLTTQNPNPQKFLTQGGFVSRRSNETNFGSWTMVYDGQFTFIVNRKTDRLITGTFSGLLHNSNFQSTATILLTDGRFNLTY